jgi:hypothetical protein
MAFIQAGNDEASKKNNNTQRQRLVKLQKPPTNSDPSPLKLSWISQPKQKNR